MLRWHRPVNSLEKVFFDTSQQENGVFNLLYQMEISSSQRISEGQFREVFTQLIRNCENLRVCIKERDGELCFVEMKDVKLDLQIVKITRQEAERSIKAKTFSYDTGPLWRAVVLDEQNDKNYVIFFYYCHSITDGLTCVRISKMLLELLENKLHGEDMNATQLGKINYGDELIQVQKEEGQRLEQDPPLKQRFMDGLKEMLGGQPLLERIFKTREVDDDRMISLKGYLSEDETRLLANKCKSNGIKVNSAITAAINLSYIDVLQKLGIVQDTYKMISSHWVSFRRHMEHGKAALGCILGNYLHSEDLTPDQISSFWDYAKTLDKDLHPKLTGKEMIHQQSLKDTLGIMDDILSLETPVFSYNISNYTQLDLGTARKVKPVSLSRQCTLANVLVCLGFVFFTFQGRLHVFADCLPRYISPDTLRSLHDGILSVIKKAI